MIFLPDLNKCKVAIVGLGYVGLPLAVEISKKNNKNIKRTIIGFDLNSERVNQLKDGFDKTNEIKENSKKFLNFIKFTNKPNDLIEADVFIVTVPTPIDKENNPNLFFIEEACKTIGKVLKSGTPHEKVPIIIFESTVYPGATEEICMPLIKSYSNLKLCTDDNYKDTFGLGYSPERINPGDKLHNISSIVKVTSGNTRNIANWVDQFYKSIIDAGTHKTKSIIIAEAAKIIENTQRDLNIALVNELSMIFNKLQIDTLDVINAAKTKWNFLPFKPGLVGGHCIGVDPYYLTHKSQQLGYYPEIILAGRKINDSMAFWYFDRLLLYIQQNQIKTKNAKALVLGFTFKENCPDIRNTQVIKILEKLKENDISYELVDPYANIKEANKQYGIKLSNNLPKKNKYEIIIVAVAHKEFLEFDLSYWHSICKEKYVILDIKGIVPRQLNLIRT